MKGGILPITDELFDSCEGSWEEPCPDGNEDCVPGSTEDSSESSVELSPCVRKSPAPSPVNSVRAATASLKSDATFFDFPKGGSSSQLAVMPDSEDKEMAQLVVSAVSKNGDGSRVYDKKQYCLFCMKPFTKISRHLEHKHSNEAEVARAIGFPKNSKERRLQLEHLRNRGNFAHNVSVLRTGEGNLVACKRPSEEMQGQEFAHCTFCQGLFTRKVLWRHVKMCRFKPDDFKPRPGKNRVLSLCAFSSTPSGISSDLWAVLNQMTHDKVSLAVKSDKCIIEFGQRLHNRFGSSATKNEYIRQKMRELGRLLLSARKVTPLKTIKELITSANFMQTVISVRDAAGYIPETNSYKTPALALKLGHSLTKISALVESGALVEGDLDSAKAARNFRQIYDAKWNELISAAAHKTIEEVKWNSPLLLPFTGDVKILHSYLDEKDQEHHKALSTECSTENWANLTKVTLTKIILFNHGREGEVSKMLLTDFTLKDQSEPHGDISDALSELDQRLCKHFQRVEIRGKRDRKVPVLLIPEMRKSLELLVKKRSECGVEKDNPYLFARPMAMSCYRGSDCIRYFANACGAKRPDTLCSTRLRKQVGTLSKVLNLTNKELDQLADFLGHDIQVHRQSFRLPEGTMPLAKISKVLMALERGQLAEFKGGTLDDISIDPDEKVEDEDVNDETDFESGSNDGHDAQTINMTTSPSLQNALVEDCEAFSGHAKLRKSKKAGEGTEMKHGRRRVNRSGKVCKPVKKMAWQSEEICAVEKHLMNCITTCRVPGKAECDDCLKAEPLRLKNRDWLAIKFYVKNRITALKRKSFSWKL